MAQIWSYSLFITMFEKWLAKKMKMKITLNLIGDGSFKVETQLGDEASFELLTKGK
jgi:hypothetical protein